MAAFLSATGFVASSTYLAIFVLCVAQSCCIPTSSELTMGLAGALAASGRLNLAGAIVVGGLGETVGAYIAWGVGRTGGRRFVERYGRYVLLTRTDLERTETWYLRHEFSGVLIGRLLPVIRSFAALSAGVAEVPYVSFGFFTLVGSLVWDGAMAGIGYGVSSSWHHVVHAFSAAGYVLAVLAVATIAYGLFHRLRTYRQIRAIELDPAGAVVIPHPREAPGPRRRLSSTPKHGRR